METLYLLVETEVGRLEEVARRVRGARRSEFGRGPPAALIAAGSAAPEFTGATQQGTSLSLKGLRGRSVVLYFYPKADTPGCTIEAKGFAQDYAKFRAEKVQVVGVSTDGCPDQKAIVQKYGLPFPQNADTTKEVARKYGVLAPQGYARRVSFHLDAQGKVLDVVDSSSAETHLARARARFLGK